MQSIRTLQLQVSTVLTTPLPLLFLFMSVYSLAQDELPEFPDYNVAWTNTYRQEAEIESQKRMWDNGNV